MATAYSMLIQPTRDTLRGYSLPKLRADVMAGFTVAVMDVPQAMAYALIAGVHPRYGLYTSIVQGIVAALFTSNSRLATGPTNTQSILIAATVTRVVAPGDAAMYVKLAVALCLLKGLVQLAFAVARMGNLVRYVSQSVMVGFMAGAGVLIALGQVKHLLGVSAGDTSELWGHLGQTDWRAVVVGVVAIGVVLGAQHLSKLLPGPLLAIVIGAVLVQATGWSSDLTMIGELPPPGRELLSPALPSFSLADVEGLMAGAVALALLGMIETVAIGKSMAVRTGERLDANQEFLAQGLANIVSSFFHCIPGSGSFTRTVVNHSAGGRTRFTGVFTGLFVLLIVVLLRDQARLVPLASLAGILMVIAAQLIDWRAMARIARASRSDAAVCFCTFAAALLLPLQYAIYIGIFLNLALYLRQASQLHIAELVNTPGVGTFIERPISNRHGQERIVFLQVEGDLFFGVADELRDRLNEAAGPGIKVIILRLKRTHSLDATTLAVLDQFARDMQVRGGHLVLCGVRPDLMERIKAYGLLDLVGRDNVFETAVGVFASAKRAIARARQLVGESIDTDRMQDVDLDEGWGYEI